jgi:hypothetical protein
MQTPLPIRRLLLEGFLSRLAASPDADAFALRGGMLVHGWDPAAGRPVGDLDFTCSLPLVVRDLRARLAAILARDTGDGVRFDARRVRLDALRAPRPASPDPMVTLFAAGEIDGEGDDVSIDLSFAVDVWPPPARGEVAGARGTAALWLCPHELVIATKLRVIADLGAAAWRPKDLADVWLALRRFPPAARGGLGALGEAIERAGGRRDELWSPAWWRDPRAVARWEAHDRRPGRLDAIAAEVRAALAPLARAA